MENEVLFMNMERVLVMEFHKKMQELRKQKGLTQEELAKELFVSRTAISKWESGRGYPNIDSLKAISALFSVTVDELLSGDELLSVAENDRKQTANRLRDVVFGLLDVGTIVFWLLPLFAQRVGEAVQAVSLPYLTTVSLYLLITYWVVTVVMTVWGVLTLTLQNMQSLPWKRVHHLVSMVLSAVGVLLFIVSLQPYAATLLFVFVVIKVFVMLKKQ